MKTITELDTFDLNCRNCDGTGWVCENHPDKPWADGYRYPGETRMTGCDCGAGAPCKAPRFEAEKAWFDPTQPRWKTIV